MLRAHDVLRLAVPVQSTSNRSMCHAMVVVAVVESSMESPVVQLEQQVVEVVVLLSVLYQEVLAMAIAIMVMSSDSTTMCVAIRVVVRVA